MTTIKGGTGSLHRFGVHDVHEPSPAEARAVASLIRKYARDEDDERQLLETCGLAEYEPGKPASYAFGRVRQP